LIRPKRVGQPVAGAGVQLVQLLAIVALVRFGPFRQRRPLAFGGRWACALGRGHQRRRWYGCHFQVPFIVHRDTPHAAVCP
jgi:hypothetical protein